ncbi:MAG TPA: hypothetical protein VMV72_07500 [Verrucomicrobiae bacterium]|nr:hypothetical protein [Verrucomicrobiae bacterium]
MDRKSRSRFALLPQSLREQLNRKLDDGAQYEEIREWLFAQTADRDLPALGLKTGEPYALAWTRSNPDHEKLVRNFGVALSAWYHSHFQRWRDEQSNRNREGCLRIVQSADNLAVAAAKDEPSPEITSGAQHFISSLLVDALSKTSKSENPSPADLSRLAHAWARMNESTLATQRHQLATEKAVDLALDALYKDIKDNPKAIESFNAFYAIVKQSTASTTTPSAN